MKVISPLPDAPPAKNAFIDAITSFLRTKAEQVFPPYSVRMNFTTPTPTPTPTRVPVPTVTPYPTPSLSPAQLTWSDELEQAATPSGVPGGLARAIGFNESSLTKYPKPNITEREETYGPAGINIRAHPNITREQAEDPEFAKGFLVKRLLDAKFIFPENVERQLLYYNVPANAYMNPGNLSYEAAWYLTNALKMLGRVPSEEYLPILQQYGFYK